MLISAHFTLHELPGIVAVLIAGVCLGAGTAALGRRALDLSLGLLVVLFTVLLIAGVLTDHHRSFSRLSIEDIVLDAGLVVVAALLAIRAAGLLGRPAGR